MQDLQEETNRRAAFANIEAKERHSVIHSNKEKAKQEKDAPEFISANDVITSGFAKTIDAEMLTMAMDFRGKLSGLTKEHAGCYHLGVVFGREGYESPNTIRKALTSPAPYSRCKKLPGWCIYGNYSGVISNWSSLCKGGLVIPDATQTLHIPFIDITSMTTDICVVFNAKPGKIAIMVALQHGDENTLKKEIPCLSDESVNEKMFG